MTRKGRSYREIRDARLQNPEVAAEYLNAARKESAEAFRKALLVVTQARQISKVARDANVQRETLYHAFSEGGNPTLQTLSSVLDVLGLDFTFSSKESAPQPNNDGE